MAQDIFLKINGIDGESQDSAHKNEIEVMNWGWRISQESNMHAGSGGGAGKATVDDLAFEHYVDRASPNLMKYCLTGKHINEATLVARKAGGNPLEYLKITLTDVLVSSMQYAGGGGGDRTMENLSLNFAKFKQEYFLQDSKGAGTAAGAIGWDVKVNKKV